MAVIRPLYQNQLEYTGEAERRGVSSVMAVDAPGRVRTGVIGTVAPNVALAGATVTVGAFQGMIGSTKGGYFTGLDGATVAGNITAADPTNARLDRIILEVLDPDNDKPGARGAVLRIVDGQAAALPSLPALPALALHVATINVPAAGGGSPTFVVNPKFTAPIGSPIPVRNVAERNEIAPTPGLTAYRIDTQTTDFVLDGAWQDSYIPIPPSAGWEFTGGVHRELVGGRIKCNLAFKMKRVFGGNFVVPAGAFTTVILFGFPTSLAPTQPVDTYAPVTSAAEGYFGQVLFRILANGTLQMLGVVGSVTFEVGGYMSMSNSWIR